MKQIFTLLISGIFFFAGSLTPGTVLAQPQYLDPGQSGESTPEEEYELLAPINGMEESLPSDENLLGTYFSSIYEIGVSLVIILAVVTLIIGGVQYMTTDSITKKGAARDTIVAAFVGIILAVGSYALLSLLIGEQALSLDLSIEPVEPVRQTETGLFYSIEYTQESGRDGWPKDIPRCRCDTNTDKLDCLDPGTYSRNEPLELSEVPEQCIDWGKGIVGNKASYVFSTRPIAGGNTSVAVNRNEEGTIHPECSDITVVIEPGGPTTMNVGDTKRFGSLVSKNGAAITDPVRWSIVNLAKYPNGDPENGEIIAPNSVSTEYTATTEGRYRLIASTSRTVTDDTYCTYSYEQTILVGNPTGEASPENSGAEIVALEPQFNLDDNIWEVGYTVSLDGSQELTEPVILTAMVYELRENGDPVEPGDLLPGGGEYGSEDGKSTTDYSKSIIYPQPYKQRVRIILETQNGVLLDEEIFDI